MQVNWKYITVALVVVSAVFTLSMTSVNAATGGMQGPGVAYQGGSQSGFSGAGQHVGDGVQTGSGMGQGSQGSRVAGEGSRQGGMGQGGQGQFTGGSGQGGMGQGGQGQFTGGSGQGGMGQGGQGQFTGGSGQHGMGQGGMGQGGQGQFTGGSGQHGIGERNIGERGIQGRNFDRQSFFGGHDHGWWLQNQKHHFWNGNSWVFGVEPVGFIGVPVPVSSCPYSPGTSGGDPNACFFNCVDNGYDPVGVCNVCCGTNY